MQKKLCMLILFFFIWQSTCFASLYYVGRDSEGTNVYFIPESVEVLASNENKFIFTVYVKEALSTETRNRMRFSRYDSDLCYPYPANMATEVFIKYRFKTTKEKIQYRQETYMLFDAGGNILGSDVQTKYYHECKTDLMTYQIYKAVVNYNSNN